MRLNTKYIVQMVDGDVVRGTFLREERGFYIFSEGNKEVPIRITSITVMSEIG